VRNALRNSRREPSDQEVSQGFLKGRPVSSEAEESSWILKRVEEKEKKREENLVADSTRGEPTSKGKASRPIVRREVLKKNMLNTTACVGTHERKEQIHSSPWTISKNQELDAKTATSLCYRTLIHAKKRKDSGST